MLGKLIKYDLMFGAKKYAIIAALTAAFLVVAAVAASLESELVLGIAIFLAVIATIVYAVMYIVISVRHLSTQLCSAESYLSYSLPTSTHTLVLSKLISIFIWGAVTAAIIIFFWVVGIGGVALAESEMSLGDLWYEITRAMQMSGIGEGGTNSLVSMFIWMCVTSSLMSISLLGLCVAVCNIPFLKERGIGTVTGVVGYFVLIFAINYAFGKIGEIFIENGAELDQLLRNFRPYVDSITIFYSIASVIVAVGVYFLTVYTVEKHRFIG